MMGVAFITNLIRREIDRAMHARPVPQWGLVKSYDPDTYAVKVELQPEQAMTEWMPLPVEHVGNGYGLLMAPEIDDLVLIGFTDGDRNAPFVMARAHNDEQKPPKLEAGEMLLMHKSKGYLKIDKDNVITTQHKEGHVLVMNDTEAFMKHKDGHVLMMDENSATLKDKSESGIVMSGDGKMLFKAQSMAFDGEVLLGGTTKGQAVVQNGDSDTGGFASLASTSRVYLASGAGSLPATPETPEPPAIS